MNNRAPLLKPSSTADRVASILRERILIVEEGEYLGSESDLAAEIGVSLPTLRQASRMLEYEQLLKINPGKGGGYFTRRPSIDTAIKSASQYLAAFNVNDRSMFMDTADPIMKTVLQAAVRCEDEALIAQLESFVANQKKNAKNLLPPDQSFKVSIDLMNLFGKMSGNILLELFANIMWNEISTMRATGNYDDSPEIVKTNYRTRLRVAEAVLARDADKAVKAWDKRSKFLRSWKKRE